MSDCALTPAMPVAPTIEILIVSYNTRDLLQDCLRSITAHFPSKRQAIVKVAVLDNASSDASAEMIAECFPSARLIRSAENLGFAKANNELARTSEADYVMLLNPDTVWRADIAVPLMRALERHRDAIVAGPRLVWPTGDIQPSAQRLPSLKYELALTLRSNYLYPGMVRRLVEDTVLNVEGQAGKPEQDPWSPEMLWATCWLLRRSDIRRYGLFDERFGLYDEDLDFCFRTRRRGGTLLYVPSVELVHIGGASSNARAKSALVRRARRRFYTTHQGALAGLAYAALARLTWVRDRLAASVAAMRKQ